MTFHLGGYFQDVDQAAAAADINAMPDLAVTVSGKFIRCPQQLAFLLGAACITIATTFTRARVESPQVRRLANYDILPVNRIATPEADPCISWQGENPLSLVPDEDISFNTNTDHAAAIEIYGLIWLGDGTLSPANGEIFTVRATAAITQVDGLWTAGALTFSQDLPAGTYDVVGMRVQAAGLVAARLAFVGGGFHPGVLAAITPAAQDVPQFRHGRMGVWGTFTHRNPPQIEVVGITSSAQEVYIDLIKRS